MTQDNKATYMSPEYVERDVFRVVKDQTIGCRGERIRLRTYRLVENPDTSVTDINYTIVAAWSEHGYPRDAVFHLGSFCRVTVV